MRTLPKHPLSSNHWSFISGQMVAELPQGEELLIKAEPSPAGPEAILSTLAQKIVVLPGR